MCHNKVEKRNEMCFVYSFNLNWTVFILIIGQLELCISVRGKYIDHSLGTYKINMCNNCFSLLLLFI